MRVTSKLMKKQRIKSEEAEEQTKSDEAASRAKQQERPLCDGEACQEGDKEIGAAGEECGRNRKREDKTSLSIKENYKKIVKFQCVPFL
eukprot:gene5748-11009_t